MEITVFSEFTSSRLRYILDFIFRSVLGTGYILSTDPSVLGVKGRAVLNYSFLGQEGIPFIRPYGLLSEEGIRHLEIQPADWEGVPCFFRTSDDAELPFDIFSAAFWLVSRYEEYLPFTPDAHGRYPTVTSLAGRYGFLQVPVVDRWIQKLAGCLVRHFPEIELRKKTFRFLSTIDIDQAWAYRHRPWWRTLGALLKELLTLQLSSLKQRIRVLAGQAPDPCDVYGYLDGIHSQYGMQPVYFILVGKYGKFGKNIPPGHPLMQKLIRERDAAGRAGVHPSYNAALDFTKLADECSVLEKILGQAVTESRQHYLRLFIPGTCRDLVRAGIIKDYSLGYASSPGFRAGTSHPFPFYDLEREHSTRLEIVPLTCMDGSLNEYMGMELPEAIDLIGKLMAETWQSGGNFVSLWHNRSLSETGRWTGWRSVFEFMLQEAQRYAHDKASEE